MTVRAVEGKKPYTGGTAIEIDENKVISLRLRDENNLIIYDSGDNEIYVDLQLDDEITPTDAFPIGVNTGRVVVDNGWDKAGTIISAKTTSGDVIKLLYADEGTLWIDNGTGTFKQIYFKGDVDTIVQAIYTYINQNANVKAFLIYGTEAQKKQKLGDAINYYVVSGKIPLLSMDSVTYTLINAVRGDGEGGTDDVYTFSSAVNSDTGKYKEVKVNVNSTTPISTTVKSYTVTEHSAGGSDIVYATQAEYNALLPGALTDNKHYFIYTESGGGGGWQPGVNTLAYWKFNSNLTDETGNMTATGSGIQYGTIGTKHYVENTATGTSCVITVNGNGLSQIGGGDFCVSFWGYIPSELSSRIPNFFGEWYNGYSPRPGLVIRVLGNNGGKIERYTDGYTIASTTSTYLGQWIHIAFTRVSGVCRCYINGIQITTINDNTDFSTGTDHVFYLLGRLGFNDGTRPVTGAKMSELIYEKQGWSSQEVADYFNQTKGDYGIS